MAGVAEDHGAQLAARRGDAEHRHVRVDRAVAVDPDADSLPRELAPVDAEMRRTPPEVEPRRPEVAEGAADDRDDLIFEAAVIVRDRGRLPGVELVDAAEVVARHRAGVRVRGREDEARARQAELLFDPRADRLGERAREADEVAREQHDAAPAPVVEGERLGVEVLDFAFGRLVREA